MSTYLNLFFSELRLINKFKKENIVILEYETIIVIFSTLKVSPFLLISTEFAFYLIIVQISNLINLKRN